MKQTKKPNNNTRGSTTKYKLSLVSRYARLVLWIFGVSDTTHYLELAKRIALLKKDSGVKFTTLYLKETMRLCQHWKSGNPTTCLKDGLRVASRRGLPLIIPGPLRLLMEAGDSRCIRVVLTLLSIFRIFKFPSEPKLATITDPFKGISETLHTTEVREVWARFKPNLPFQAKEGRTELRPLKTAGPNHKKSILGAPLDALAWLNAPEELRSSFKTLAHYFNSPLAEMLEEEGKVASQFTPVKAPILGKLSLKAEPAGKVRVFAIVDVWTQSVLEPLHDGIALALRNIPQDGTFNQSRPLDLLRSQIDDHTKVFSFDLSAATDRLPIAVQVQVLACLFSIDVARAWAKLLTGRDYWLKDEAYRYSVGQPMGALSSFGMLALTHHLLVQYAAYRIGRKGWFSMYALLGDDIVIADEAVAMSYHFVMATHLGIGINDSKTLVSDHGVMEFAKRLVSPTEEFTPLGPKNILGCLTHPGNIPGLLLDLFGKGGTGDWNEKKVSTYVDSLGSDVLKISDGGKRALIWSIIGPFGFVKSSGFAPETDANSLDNYQSTTLVKSIEESLLYYYSKEWESAFDKTIVAALGVWKRSTNDKFVECPNPHIFPSYRNLAIRALESVDEISESRPLKYLAYPSRGRARPVLLDKGRLDWMMRFPDRRAPVVRELTVNQFMTEMLEAVPKVSPLDNPWVKPKVAKPKIRRLGIEFFKRVSQVAKRREEESR